MWLKLLDRLDRPCEILTIKIGDAQRLSPRFSADSIGEYAFKLPSPNIGASYSAQVRQLIRDLFDDVRRELVQRVWFGIPVS